MALSRFRGVLSVTREGLRTQLWPLPTICVILAVASGVILPRVDARFDGDLSASLTSYLFGGGADAARTVLAAIAGSLITVTALTFSLTVVTLQLASSQFSPRLLRTFTRDRFVHATLALFLATFAYALTVLRTVRTANDDQQTFVPHASVTVAFALTLASVICLVLFLAHLAGKIRVETLLRDVHTDATHTARHVLTERRSGSGTDAPFPAIPPNSVPVLAAASGFLSRVDEDAMLAAATDTDTVIVIDQPPGGSVIAGTPVGAAWPRAADAFDTDTAAALTTRVSRAISTHFEPTAAQDVGFGLRQLTDVAIKALSPGINDPTTAIHALGHSAALLCELTQRDLGNRILRDDQHRIRVVLRGPSLRDLLDLAVAQPRRYGAADPLVLARLLTLLRELAWIVELPDHRRAITDQLTRLMATADAQGYDPTERHRLTTLAEHVRNALAGQWSPDTDT